MAKANTRRGLVVLGLVGAACIAWISWAWSPEVESVLEEPPGSDQEEAAPAPVAAPAPAPAAPPEKPRPPEPLAPEPQQPVALAEESPAEPPERIPTPHLMSLDQTKPPEASGPLAELKHRYASESRSAESSAIEDKLRGMIAEARNVPSELVQSISCRRSVCKIDTQWTARRRIGFVVVLESFKQMYDQRVAVEPPSGRAEDGTYPTTLYLQVAP